MVVKLDKAMYGTRDALAAWQAELEKTMIELGFRPVVSTSCLYYHPLWRIRVVGHVDDLMCVSPRSGLDIFLEKLKGVYELTSKFLGPDVGEEQQGKFLVLTWTGDVKLVKEALDEWDMREAKEVETPGMTDEYDVQSLLNADLMSKESAAKYRRTAAKLNYLALDNPLIAFASKEASRSMSSPRQGEEMKLKRILRSLRKRRTTTYLFEWQDHPEELTWYTDRDWAGWKLTRRSTSGALILHGSHLLLQYSRTQAGVALSSAEAELNAALKMGCEILGISQFCRELGEKVDIKINGGSSAVKGILARRGC